MSIEDTKLPLRSVKAGGYVFDAFLEEEANEDGDGNWRVVVTKEDGEPIGEYNVSIDKPIIFGIPDPADDKRLDDYCKMLLKYHLPKIR